MAEYIPPDELAKGPEGAGKPAPTSTLDEDRISARQLDWLLQLEELSYQDQLRKAVSVRFNHIQSLIPINIPSYLNN